MEIIIFKKIEVIKKAAAGIIWKFKNLLHLSGKFGNRYLRDKRYSKVRCHRHFSGEYRAAAHGICNLKYSVPKEIFIAFHNGFNCDYHLIIKALGK